MRGQRGGRHGVLGQQIGQFIDTTSYPVGLVPRIV
jgi:hypothetical protein